MDFYISNITTEFDDEFENRFEYLPWIGKKYKKSKSKILVVGESIYNWGKTELEKTDINKKITKKSFIRNLVKYHGLFHTLNEDEIGGGKKGKLFSNLEKTFYDSNEISDDQKQIFWETVAFYEFCQKPMKDIKERPTKDDFVNGAKEIFLLINILNPKYTILLGTDYNKINALQKLVKGVFSSKDKKVDSFLAKKIDFELDGQKKIIAIGHPSSSHRNYNWGNWSKYLANNQALLDEIIFLK